MQAFILLHIAKGVQKGKAIRKALDTEGIHHGASNFHACLRRLKRDGLVRSKFVKAADGAHGRETVYSLTPVGKTALKRTRDFYRRLELLAGE